MIDEVKKKIAALKYSRAISIRPVIIYAGEIEESIIEEDFFDRVVSLNELFT